jgi:transcriptional regulator with XRE-family HTH domain
MSAKQPLSYTECLQARALLSWTVRDLEKASQVSIDSISRLERSEGYDHPRILRDLRAAFEASGITFTETGLRLTVDKGPK